MHERWHPRIRGRYTGCIVSKAPYARASARGERSLTFWNTVCAVLWKQKLQDVALLLSVLCSVYSNHCGT